MPWRFSLCLAAVLLLGAVRVSSAQGPAGMPGPGWGGPVCPPDGFSPGGPTFVPDHDIFYDDDSRLDLILKETLRRSWIRFEYLNWNLQKPGNDRLGAPLATEDSSQPFQAFDPGSIPRLGVAGQIPTLNDFQFESLNGLRATIGVPTQLGAFEFDAWAFGQSTQSQRIRPQVDAQTGFTLIPAVTLQSGGTPSDSTMILFDTDFRDELRANLFGAQGNFYFNPITPNLPISLRPVLGVRYVRYYEDFVLSGTDQSSGTNPRITSDAHNNLFGPQIGLRLAHDNQWFSLGVEPKLMLGINRHIDTVTATQILDPASTPVHSRQGDTDFAPVFDLASYFKVHVSDNFSLFAGYEILTLTNITRSTDQIVYNSPLVSTGDPLIGLKKHRESLFIHGLMVGGEFRFH